MLFRSPGRFDNVFGTSLPDADARGMILRIHLEKRNIPADHYGKALDTIVQSTEGFAGAELEQIIRGARKRAYRARMQDWRTKGGEKPVAAECIPTIEELVEAKKRVTPMSVLDKDSIDKIEKFVRERCQPVSGNRVNKPTRRSRRVSTIRPAATVDPGTV